MRELNQQEIEHVSGAGFIADAAAALGQGIGKVVDAGLSMAGFGVGEQSSEAGATLGRGIGMIAETAVNVFSNVFNRIFNRG